MPKRSEKRDTAKAEYIARKSRGEEVSLRELAQELGASYQTVRNWKTADQWDAAEAEAGRTAGEPEQRREAERGGQPSGGAGGEQRRGEGRSLQRRLFRHAHRGGAGAGGQDAAGEPGGPGA